MTPIDLLVRQPLARQVGWALVHFLWQGAAIGGLLWLGLEALRRRTANARYLAACLAMALLAAFPVVTFLLLPSAGPAAGRVRAVGPPADVTPPVAGRIAPARVDDGGKGPEPPHGQRGVAHTSASTGPVARTRPPRPGASAVTATASADTTMGWRESVRARLEPTLPWCVAAWLAGVVLLSFWHLAAWGKVQRLRTSGAARAGDALQAAARRLAAGLGIHRPVRLLESVRVTTPMVIGWLRPVVLLPVSAATGLTPEQIEAILAHELAHIRRHDYLVNLLQSVVETLLFYHPAVWWVSRRIRIEREHCCDDAAVGACGDRSGYAGALAALAERATMSRAAVTAGGGCLLDRIRRLLAPRAGHARGARTCAAGAILVAGLLVLGVCWAVVATAGGPVEAAGQPASGGTRPITWGKAIDGVVCGVALDRDRYVLGQKVQISVFLRNTLARALTCNVGSLSSSRRIGDVEHMSLPVDARGGRVPGGARHRIPAGATRRIFVGQFPTRPLLNWSSDLHFIPAKTPVVIVCTPMFGPKVAPLADPLPRTRSGKVTVEVVDSERKEAAGRPATRATEDPPVLAALLGRKWSQVRKQLAGRGIVGRDVREQSPKVKVPTYILSRPYRGYGNVKAIVSDDTIVEVEVWSGAGLPGLPRKVVGIIEPGIALADVERRHGKPVHVDHDWEGLRTKAWRIGDVLAFVQGPSDIRLGKTVGRVFAFHRGCPPSGQRLRSFGDPEVLGPLLRDSGSPVRAGAPLTTRPADPSAVAKRLTDRVGGRWRPGRERAAGVGPELSSGTSFRKAVGAAAPYWVLFFPFDENAAARIRAFQANCNMAVTVLASGGRFTLLGGRDHPKPTTSKIIEALEIDPNSAAPFAALVREAVLATPKDRPPRGRDQHAVGLDFSDILTASGQMRDVKALPWSRRLPDDAAAKLAKAKKVWALCQLLDHGHVDVKIMAAKALGDLADPRSAAALLAAAKRNNYSVSGSENATLHEVFRDRLHRALAKITGRRPKPASRLDAVPARHFGDIERWLIRRYLSAPAGRAAKVDIRIDRLKIEANPPDNLPGGLYAIGPYELRRGQAPDAHGLYVLRTENKIGDGYEQLVGRLGGNLYGLGMAGGAILEAVEFTRVGNRILATLRYAAPLRGAKLPAHSVYLRAWLPKLPPGRYEARIDFQGHVQTGRGKLVAAPKGGSPEIPAMTCTFRVPAEPSATRAATVQKLIARLGASRFADRDAAQKALVRMGEAAIPALRAAAAGKHAERALRAGQALKEILDRPWGNLDEIVKAYKAVLPEGSAITRTALDSVPDGWHTLDRAGGFLVEGTAAVGRFRTWFLPRDWIGIRKPVAGRRSVVYWDGVLAGPRCKTITEADAASIHNAVRKLGMSTPSLVNSGWPRAGTIFKDRFAQADRTARQLIERFCKTDADRDEAAYSLIVLGVPTRGVFLERALKGQGRAQEFCVSALGYFGGKDAARVLGEVLNDPRSAGRCGKYAAMALERIADPDSGPALLRAFDKLTHPEAATHAAKAMARIRYRPGAAKVLARMNKEQNPYYKSDHAGALASLRYREAIPAIQRMCKARRFTAEWALDGRNRHEPSGEAEMALLRLTGSWGEPADGVRLLLLPPAKADLGRPFRVALLIENVGDDALDVLKLVQGRFLVNGRPHRMLARRWDGMSSLFVNEVWVYPFDLSGAIAKRGTHKIRYEVGKVASNTMTVKVVAPMAEARGAELQFDVLTINSMIKLYSVQHDRRHPGVDDKGKFDGQLFADQMTIPTDPKGRVCRGEAGRRHYLLGPYLRRVPVNPLVDAAVARTVSGGPGKPPADGRGGWWFDTRSGSLRPNHASTPSAEKRLVPAAAAPVSDRARMLVPRLLERVASGDARVRAALVDELVVIARDDDVEIVSFRYGLSANDYQGILQRALPGLAGASGDIVLKRRLARKVCYISSRHRLERLEPAVSEFLKDPDRIVRGHAVQLAHLVDARSAAPLIATCLGDASLAAEAARVLVAFRSPLVKAYLIGQIHRGPKTDLHHVVQDLGAIGATDAVAHIEPLLRDPDENLPVWAVRALAQLGARGSRHAVFEAMVRNKPPLKVQPDAIAALVKWRDERAIPAALAHLTAARLDVRRRMSGALVDYQAAAIAPTLIGLLESPTPVSADPGTDSNIRRDAIVLLTRLEQRAAIPAMRRILKGRDKFLSRAAGDALASLGDEGAIPDLVKRLSGDYATWTAAASALARYGRPRTAAAVVARLKESDSHSHRVRTLNALSLAANPKTGRRLESIWLSPGRSLAPEAYAAALQEQIHSPVQISAQARKGSEDVKVAFPRGSAWHALERLIEALNSRAYRCSLFIGEEGGLQIVTNEEAFRLWETHLAAMGSELSATAQEAHGLAAGGESIAPGNVTETHEGRARDGASGQPATRPATMPAESLEARIARLIAQLGSEKHAERAAVEKALVQIGKPAIRALQAACGDKDAERAVRAEAALLQIKERFTLKKEAWRNRWEGISLSFRLSAPGGRAGSMSLEVDPQGKAIARLWEPRRKALVRYESVLSRKDLDALARRLGMQRPWELNLLPKWRFAARGTLSLRIAVGDRFVDVEQPWPPPEGLPRTRQNAQLLSALMAIRNATSALIGVVRRDAAIRAEGGATAGAAAAKGAPVPKAGERTAIRKVLDLLELPWQTKLTDEELDAAAASIRANADQAVDAILKAYDATRSNSFRHRAVQIFERLGTARARAALLDVALGRTADKLASSHAWAARAYLRTIRDRADARKLLASDEAGVLNPALLAMKGQPVDAALLKRIGQIIRRKAKHPANWSALSLAAADVVSADPRAVLLSERADLVLAVLAGVAQMPEKDKMGRHSSMTYAEMAYSTLLRILSEMPAEAGPLLKKASAARGGAEREVLIISLASRGDAAVRKDIHGILADGKAGLRRAWAARGLGAIGTAGDLPLLKRLAETDPLARGRGGDVGPPGFRQAKFYPVRDAAKDAIQAIERKAAAAPARPATRPAMKLRASFDMLAVEITSNWRWNRTITINGDGTYVFDLQQLTQVPGKRHMQPDGKHYIARYRLRAAHLRRLAKLLEATNWLARPGKVNPRGWDGTKYALTLVRRRRKTTTVCYGRQEQAYKDLIRFLTRLNVQEWLLYQMTPDARYRSNPVSQLDNELDAVLGSKPGKTPPYAPVLDYERLLPGLQSQLKRGTWRQQKQVQEVIRKIDEWRKGLPATQPARAPSTLPAEASWSKAVNGLEARVTLKRTEVNNGTPILSTFLQLRNVSDRGEPMKLAWSSEKLKPRVIDDNGRELRTVHGAYDGPAFGSRGLAIPRDRTVSLDISCRGLGITADKAGLIDLGPSHSWVFDTDEKGYYLQAVLEIPKPKEDRDETGWNWHGRIEIPPVRVPLKAQPPDPAKVGPTIEKLGRKMIEKPGSGASEEAARALSLFDDVRAIPWYLKAMDTRSYGLKFAAIDRLSRFRGDRALEGLKKGMTQSNTNLRLAAAYGLARSPHPDARKLLLSMRNDPYYGVRITVLHAFGRKDTPESRKLLKEMMRDSNKTVRDEARRYLNLLQAAADRALPGSRLSVQEAMKASSAFAVVCEAEGDPEGPGGGKPAAESGDIGQRIKVLTVLAGKAGQYIRVLPYKVRDEPGARERGIRKGERVIWIGANPAPDHYIGLKALPDTPESRRAIAAEMAWGPVANGLQCRLLPQMQTLEVVAGTKPQDFEVCLTYELRNVGSRSVRFLPWYTPLEDIGGKILECLGPGQKKADYWGPRVHRPRLEKKHFATIKPGGKLAHRFRLPYDLTQPGPWRVSVTTTRLPAQEGMEVKAYYGDDAEKARKNPDNVWTGKLVSNVALVDVRAAHAAGGKARWQALAGRVHPGMTVRQMKVLLPPARPGKGPQEIVTLDGARFAISYPLDAARGVQASGIAQGKSQDQWVLDARPRLKPRKDLPMVTTRPATEPAGAGTAPPPLGGKRTGEIRAEVAAAFAQAVKEHAVGFKPPPAGGGKAAASWSLICHDETKMGGKALNRSAAMDALVAKMAARAAKADQAEVNAYVAAAGRFLTHKEAAYRAVACEVLYRFPRQMVERGLVASVGALLDDHAVAFVGADVSERSIGSPIVKLGVKLTVAEIAQRTLSVATSCILPNRKVFQTWWQHNNDYRRRLWYWALRWRTVKPESDLAGLADLEPREALKILLLVANNPAGRRESLLGFPPPAELRKLQFPKEECPKTTYYLSLGPSPKTIADFVRRHSLKGVLMEILRQKTTWPEVAGKEEMGTLLHQAVPVMALAFDRSELAAVRRAAENPTPEVKRYRGLQEALAKLAADLARRLAAGDQFSRYLRLYAQYKARTLAAAVAGDKEKVAARTDEFNAAIGGRLLYVRVSRIGPGGGAEVLIARAFGDRRVLLPKIHYRSSTQPHVTVVKRSGRESFVLVETNKLAGGKYADGIHIAMALEPIPPASQPAVRKPATSGNRPADAAVEGRADAAASPRRDQPLDKETLLLLGRLQRKPWAGWVAGTEVVRQFLDEKRPGQNVRAYVQPRRCLSCPADPSAPCSTSAPQARRSGPKPPGRPRRC